MVALRDLEAGEECYADYGDGYWRKHGAGVGEADAAAEPAAAAPGANTTVARDTPVAAAVDSDADLATELGAQ